MLQAVDRFGVEKVNLSFTAPLVLTTDFKAAVCTLGCALHVSNPMSLCCLFGDLIKTNATKAAYSANEKLLNDFCGETNGFKDLRPRI